MSEPAVRLEHLRKSYDNVQALDDLSLAIFSGEVLGLIEPNGAGKTTTIKIIVGLLEPDSGRVEVLGQDISADRVSYKAHVGYMPEVPALPEYLTASEFLGYVARIRNIPKKDIQPRISELLRALDLTVKARETIASLSKGMRAKLAFAAATIHNPTVLIMDEPLLGIDPAGQHLLKERLTDIAKHGGAVLVSTHQLDTAERLCSKVAIMHHGRNVITGALESLRSQAHVGGGSLEEIFLKLTEEAHLPEPELPRRRSLFRRGG